MSNVPPPPPESRTTRKISRKSSKSVSHSPLSSPESDYADAAAAEVITDLDQLFTKKNGMLWNEIIW